MDLEHFLPLRHIRNAHRHLPVETAGPQQSRVQNVRTVGGGDDDDAFVLTEAVHFDQQLVQGLLPLVMAAAEACAPSSAHGVDLVDEDDAGGLLLRHVEGVPHPGRTDADEHLNEVRAADAEERYLRLAGHRPGQVGLAGSRRAYHQDPLGNPGAHLVVFFRRLEEIDDFLHLLLFFLQTGHILEGDAAAVLLVVEAGLALAEAHDLVAAPLGVLHEDEPEDDEDQDHEDGGQDIHDPGPAHGLLTLDLKLALLAQGIHVGPEGLLHHGGHIGLELGSVLQLALDGMVDELDGDHIVLGQLLLKLRIGQLLVLLPLGLGKINEHQDHQKNEYIESGALEDVFHEVPPASWTEYDSF